MKYQLIIDKGALKFISKQPIQAKKRLLQAISKLPEGDVIKMSGKFNLYRLRVGSYRIIYTIDNNRLIIKVVEVGNRGDVYK